METGSPALIKPMNINEGTKQDAAYDSWPPAGSPAVKIAMPEWGATIWRGMRCICPACGKAPIFNGYLRVYQHCKVCQAPLGDMPADDAPPYIAMLVVLHVMAFFVVMIFKFGWQPADWEYGGMLILLVLACMVALRMAKGAVIGILLKLGMSRPVLK